MKIASNNNDCYLCVCTSLMRNSRLTTIRTQSQYLGQVFVLLWLLQGVQGAPEQLHAGLSWVVTVVDEEPKSPINLSLPYVFPGGCKPSKVTSDNLSVYLLSYGDRFPVLHPLGHLESLPHLPFLWCLC